MAVADIYSGAVVLLLLVHWLLLMYMRIEDLSAHVLLNLLNELWKIYKNPRLAEHLNLFFRNEFNKFNNRKAYEC